MKYNILETIIGFIFLVIASILLVMLLKQQNNASRNDYAIYADCDNVDGIISGSDVKIAGVKIGVVDNLILDNQKYLAKVKILLKDSVKLPADSNLSIESSGIIGSKFIAVYPGMSDDHLKSEDVVYLKAAINLDYIINQLLNSLGNKSTPASATN